MKDNKDFDSAAKTPAHRPTIYARSNSNDDHLKQRLEDVRELARMNGLDVAEADTVVEHGSGADIAGRPGLQRLLQMAERGEISHLVTLQTSDLSRDYHELHEILVKMNATGVQVITEPERNELRRIYSNYNSFAAEQQYPEASL